MEKDYSHLIGKEVRHVRGGYTAVVSAIDPDIGISLHRKGDVEDIRMCLIHPAIHATKHKLEEAELHGTVAFYEISFRHWVEGIESGEFSEDWSAKDRYINTSHGVSGVNDWNSKEYMNAVCPFK